MGSMVVHTYRFYLGGEEVIQVEPIMVTEEVKDQLNADQNHFGLSGKWKRRVDVEYAKEILSD